MDPTCSRDRLPSEAKAAPRCPRPNTPATRSWCRRHICEWRRISLLDSAGYIQDVAHLRALPAVAVARLIGDAIDVKGAVRRLS